MYNILEKVFFGDTLVLKFRNIQFWNDLIIGGVKYMYEQDYIIRMNNEVIRTMVKLLLNKDTGVPVNISEGTIKSENKKMLEAANGQSGIDNIKKMEEEILTLVDADKEGALEKALVFYGYLNELTEDALFLKRVEKTTDNIIIIKSGFNTLHNTPNTDFRYFTFISLFNNSIKSGVYCFISLLFIFLFTPFIYQL